MTDRQRNMVLNAIKMGGVFISCGNGKKINIMDSDWGTLGRMWNRDVFILPVRKKKYSHELISKNKSFVVNIPTHDMANQLIRCSNMSGREINKFEVLGFNPEPAMRVNSVGISECIMQLECKVVYTSEMRESKLNPTIARDMYVNREYHTLFFGEIIRVGIKKH